MAPIDRKLAKAERYNKKFVPIDDEIKEYCKGEIAHFKIPRYIKFTQDFPMTVTGKIRKVEMREVSIKELGLESADSIETA